MDLENGFSDDEDRLDDLLDVINADSSRNEAVEATPTSAEVDKGTKKRNSKNDSFEEVFGTPINQKRLRCSNEPSSSRALVTTQISEPCRPEPKKLPSSSLGPITRDDPIDSKRENEPVFRDSFTQLSLYKSSVIMDSTAGMSLADFFKSRHSDLKYINLTSLNYWYRMSGNKHQNIWTSAVLVRKMESTKRSLKGNEYIIWEVNDLKQLDKNWSLFLFGSSCKSPNLELYSVGHIIDLISPGIIKDNSNGIKLSVSSIDQIQYVGKSSEFAFCASLKKDGGRCRAIVNRSICQHCIFHAASELQKIKRKNQPSKVHPPPGRSQGTKFTREIQTPENVKVVNFPRHVKNTNPIDVKNNRTPSLRMELLHNLGEVKRNSAQKTKPASISYVKEAKGQNDKSREKPAICDLSQSMRHLSEKDRKTLEMFSNEDDKTTIPIRIAETPNASGRNLLKYLNQKSQNNSLNPKQSTAEAFKPPTTVKMSGNSLQNMKKALAFVKKSGPIPKQNPNSLKKKCEISPKSLASSSKKPSEKVSDDGKGINSKEIETVINAESSHQLEVEGLQQEDYFNKLEKQEALENKLLNTFQVPCSATMCRQCKYIALSQSEFCKNLGHVVRIVQTVKRFFKCKNCGCRAMSLDRLPKQPCKSCSSNNWEVTSMGKDRKGPTLDTEVLSIRGDEEKFIGSSTSKRFLHLT